MPQALERRLPRRPRPARRSSSALSLTTSAMCSAGHTWAWASRSAGHSAGRRLRSKLTSAPASRARCMPSQRGLRPVAGSVRLLEQTWKTATPSKRLHRGNARAEQQVGRGRPIEAEAALALGVQGDERQRGVGLVGAHHVVGADAGIVSGCASRKSPNTVACRACRRSGRRRPAAPRRPRRWPARRRQRGRSCGEAVPVAVPRAWKSISASPKQRIGRVSFEIPHACGAGSVDAPTHARAGQGRRTRCRRSTAAAGRRRAAGRCGRRARLAGTGTSAPPTMAMISRLEALLVIGPSRSMPSAKMVGNMIELNRPMAMMLYIATWPVAEHGGQHQQRVDRGEQRPAACAARTWPSAPSR